jgi:hypothetical protein
MDCLKCMDLKQALECGLSKYREACSAAFYHVSTELAAKKKVDMERARNAEEHQLICALAPHLSETSEGSKKELSFKELLFVAPVSPSAEKFGTGFQKRRRA